MREILFKAKKINAGEWIEGYYVRHVNRQTCVLGDEIKPEDENHLICFSGFADWNMPRKLMCAEVDPSTLCQYTGLTDKDGKKIYEHDIVSFCDTYSTESGQAEIDCVGEVFWDDETLSFCVTNRISAESHEALGECAVIGNVFGNPELLK